VALIVGPTYFSESCLTTGWETIHRLKIDLGSRRGDTGRQREMRSMTKVQTKS